MLILSPEERARAWHDAVMAEASEREYKRHMLVSAAFQMVGFELRIYSDDFASAFKSSFELLEAGGLIGREELRRAFEEIDEHPGTVRAFAAALGRHLGETADIRGLGDDQCQLAAQLSERWRRAATEDLAATVEEEDEVYVTVAEVAAVYDVTPQAVYKWIHRGAIKARTRPGGSYQIPLSAVTSDERFDVARARRVQRDLLRRREGQAAVSTDEMVQQMRSRRAASR